MKTTVRGFEPRPPGEYLALFNDLPDRGLRDRLDGHAKDHRVLFFDGGLAGCLAARQEALGREDGMIRQARARALPTAHPELAGSKASDGTP